MDHLERVGRSNEFWRFPKKEDSCEVDILQIKGVKPEYEWDYSNSRTHKLKLNNHVNIDHAVKNSNVSTFTD